MKKISTLTGYFLFFLFTFITYVSGQDYSFRQFTLQDGLVQMQVQCLFQDSRGYIWVGTKGGVSKFNGETFESFRQQDGLLHPYIYDIAEDSKGNIWLASSKGLTKYNGQDFTTFPLDKDIVPKRVLNIIIDNKDNIWINRYGLIKQHTLKFNGQDYKVIKDKIRSDNFSTYWMEYDSTTHKILVVLKGEGIGQILEDTIVSYITRDLDYGSIGFDQQLNQIKFAEGSSNIEESFILKKDSLWSLWKYNKSSGSYFDINYTLLPKDYYFFKNGYLFCFRKKQKKNELIQKVNFNQIKTFFIDKDNTIWIGSEEGLIQFFGEKGFKHFDTEPFTYVWNLVEDNANKLWFCGYDTRLKTYDVKKIEELRAYENAKGIHEYKYFYFGGLKDNNGNLLFPMHENILKYNGNEYSIIESKGNKNGVNLQLWEDNTANFIIAGVSGGINILENYKVTSSFGEKDGLHPCSYIIAIGKDKNDEYWLGSFQGLSKLNLQTKGIQTYTKESNKLPSDGVISIAKDSRGNMWFGSRNGLLTYDYEKDSIFNISPDLNTDISFLIPIDEDHLMLGALNGLYVLDLNKFYENGEVLYKHFNHRNGYLGIEPTQNTFLKDSRGQIWIASSTSVDKFDPKILDLSIPTINTRITHVNREKLAYDDNALSIPEGTNALEFRFEGIGFERPLHIQYAYQLEGYEEEWSKWRKEDFAVYNNLSSGNYTFKVKSKMGSYSAIKPTISCIDFTVSLPFWKEPDFYQKVSYILPFILVLLVSFFWKTVENMRLAKKNSQIDFLNKELSHRVKNNLQFITSLMNLQERRLEDEGAKAAISESKNRLQVMSSLYRRLYHRDDAKIDLGEYLKELATQFQKSYKTDYNDLIVAISIKDKIEIDAEIAGKIGLIINELVMNSVKHAFSNQPHPKVNIFLSLKGESDIQLLVKDNGRGLLEEVDLHQSKSLGMRLINNLVDQLQGDLAINSNNGLQFEFFFKKINLTT